MLRSTTLLHLAAALFLAACTPSSPPPPPSATAATSAVTAAPGAPTPAERRRAAVAGVVDAINAHDPRRLGALFAPDAVSAGVGPNGWEETRGRAAIEAEHAGLFAHQPDVRVATTRLFDVGSVLVQEWVTTGTDRKTGAKRGFSAASVFTFDAEGQITRDHTYFDSKVRSRIPELPAGPPAIVTQARTPAEEAHVEAVQMFYARRSAASAQRLTAMFDDSIVYAAFHEPDDIVGKDATTQALLTASGRLARARITATWMAGLGDFVVAEVVTRAAEPSTAHPGAMHTLEIVELRGADRIVAIRSYGSARELDAAVK